METVKNAADYVSDKVQSTTSGASKEANKDVAKDNNASLGTRFEAGKDAVSDKVDEHKHDTSAEVNKQKTTH